MSIPKDSRMVIRSNGYPLTPKGVTTPWFTNQKAAMDFVETISKECIGEELYIVKPVTRIFIEEPELKIKALEE